ncbi:MAG TPA: tetratricopeptide repeat protein [Kofleriaceae bacterium]|nr:tetratricopeptide repeat protein [Kofleriaceae bacterium]
MRLSSAPLIVALLACLLALSSTARAQANMEQAKKEFDAGQTAYDLAKYDEALTRFTKAYELSKLPAILYNLGQAQRRLYETGGALDNLRRSREMYRSYLRLVPFSSDRAMAESLLKGVEEEYAKQLHAQRDKLLIEAKGLGALNLAEDFIGQGDVDAAEAALERFRKAQGNKRTDVARGERVRARVQAARNNADASAESFARALSLDPATAPPPDSEKAALAAFAKAQARMKGRPPLSLTHVPPSRLRIGQAPRLRVEVANDSLSMVRGLEVGYRAGGGAFAMMSAKPGDVTFPPTFNAGLAAGTRIEYWVAAVDEDGAVLDTLGSAALPFVLNVDAKPPVPVHKKWQFWVGLGAGVLVVAGAAAAIGVTQAPPERIPIPVSAALLAP